MRRYARVLGSVLAGRNAIKAWLVIATDEVPHGESVTR